jgi:hypothetical protein
MIITKIQGGIGNQMFQYATGRSISLKNNSVCKLDISFYNEEKFSGIYRLNQFNIIENIALKEEIDIYKNVPIKPIYYNLIKKIGLHNKYNKKTHIIEIENAFPDSKVLNCRDNVYLDGWLSKEKYFEDIRPILLKDFTLKFTSDEYNIGMLQEIVHCNSVSIHIRRGDYLDNGYFTSLPLSYYHYAINQIKQRIDAPVFFAFSDDIEWVKKNLANDCVIKYIDKNSHKLSYYYTQKDFEDLNLIKHCKHHIIANSTFSWWGAWLNPNPSKIVIAPSKWYNDPMAQRKYERGGFIPIKWEKIPIK